MSNFWISLIISVASSIWLFNKLQDRSGRNTSQSLTAVGVAGLIIFVVCLVVMGLIF